MYIEPKPNTMILHQKTIYILVVVIYGVEHLPEIKSNTNAVRIFIFPGSVKFRIRITLVINVEVTVVSNISAD